MSTDRQLDRPLEDLSIDELQEALRYGDVTIEELRENEAVRRCLTHIFVKKDMQEHAEIYERLAQV